MIIKEYKILIFRFNFVKIVQMQLPDKTRKFLQPKITSNNFLMKMHLIFNNYSFTIKIPSYEIFILDILYKITIYIQ
jgi:hypothetical protein